MILEAVDPGARGHHAPGSAECLTPPADGVDLVDENDALPAPFPRQFLRLARHPADDHDVHPNERLSEARARHRDEWAVESGRNCLRKHRLACARRSEEQETAFALAACSLERLTRLPEIDDALDFLLGLDLTSHMLQLHAPVRVARL